MKEFLFKLFRLEYEKPFCRSCQLLETLLESERRDKHRLLDKLLITEAQPEIQIPEISKPIPTNNIPWSIMRQRLEQADALKARELDSDRKKSIEKLEEELAVESAK